MHLSLPRFTVIVPILLTESSSSWLSDLILLPGGTVTGLIELLKGTVLPKAVLFLNEFFLKVVGE